MDLQRLDRLISRLEKTDKPLADWYKQKREKIIQKNKNKGCKWIIKRVSLPKQINKIMSKIIKMIKDLVIRENMKPSKVVKLQTGLTCYHYENGTIDVR